MKKRIKFLDIEKGLLMILVIIGHFNFFEYEARTVTLIYSFHMPAFFIISGILIHIDKTTHIKDIIIKQFKSSIIPYYIFYFISFVICDARQFNNYNQSLKYMINGIGNPDYSINLPLWFFTLYFCAITIYKILDLISIKLINCKTNNDIDTNTFNLKREIFLFSSIIICSFLSFIYCKIIKGTRLIYNFETSLLMLPFIYFGRIIKLIFQNEKFKNIINTYKQNKYLFFAINIFIFLIIFTIWYCLSMVNLRVDFNARNIRNLHLTYINAILGFILFSYITFIVSKIHIINNLFTFLGSISQYILAYHIPANLIIYFVLIDFTPEIIVKHLNSFNIISVIYRTTIQISFCIFMFYIHKYIKEKLKYN